jgi:cell division protein ZapA (FtsZ GTPase activity inhibitor)
MSKSDLRIDILGASFSIVADEDAAYLQGLLSRYYTAVENTQKSTGMKDPLKISILTGFLLCDEIQKLHTREPGTSGEAERLTLDLITRIDEALEDKS